MRRHLVAYMSASEFTTLWRYTNVFIIIIIIIYVAFCGILRRVAQICSLYFTTAREIFPQNIAPFTGVSGAHVMHGSLGLPESILIY